MSSRECPRCSRGVSIGRTSAYELAPIPGVEGGDLHRPRRLRTPCDGSLDRAIDPCSYIEALGGHLEIAAVFGDERIPVAVGPGEGEGSAAPQPSSSKTLLRTS
jgi:hypothetical protein